MIHRVVIAASAAKQLRKVPSYVRAKLHGWQRAVSESGLETVRRIPGYHDEPLQGQRSGQRSIRLSLAYRAIYVIKNDGVEFVSIEEVHKHDY